jgi:CspA family cold shock protein
MQSGTVKFFNYQKGYGFIAPDDGGKDVFVHIGEVERANIRDLNEGDKLRFEMGKSTRGGQPEKTKAVKLQLVS